MKILHLTSSVSSQSAVFRLNDSLNSMGNKSNILVAYDTPFDKNVSQSFSNLRSKIKTQIEILPLKFYNKNSPFDFSFVKNFDLKDIKKFNPDIINLHWINHFISIKSLLKLSNLNIPIVWTLHDSWAFTGGCHIPFPCEKWKYGCSKCPKLNSNFKFDLSYLSFKQKKNIYDKIDFQIIGPSSWITENAKQSFLLKEKNIVTIPNGINTLLFKKYDKFISRELFNIPKNKKIILYGANHALEDKNKGYSFLKEAFDIILKENCNTHLVIFGTNNLLPFTEDNITYLGNIRDPFLLPLIYSTADVFVCPSISENFSNSILESTSCETPVICFNIGGNSDIIKNNINGFLIEPFNIQELANQILKSFTFNFSFNKLFKIENTSKKYIEFYNNVINK